MNDYRDSYGQYNQDGQPNPYYYPSHYPPNQPVGYPPQSMEPPEYPSPYAQPRPEYPLPYPGQYPQQPYYEPMPPYGPGQPADAPWGGYEGPIRPPFPVEQRDPTEKELKKILGDPPAVSKGLLNIYGWLEALVTAWIIMVVFCTFFLRTVGVDGPSMNPTLEDKDKLVVTSMFYQPSRGDIVVIKPTEKMAKALVKRVIGLPGEQIEISANTMGQVYVNGAPLEPEEYIRETVSLSPGEEYILTVPDGCVFVMGDNRNNSVDSRSPQVGAVDIRYIMGKVIFRISPNMGLFTSPSYNGG